MGKSKLLNLLIAMLFFIGAGVFVISATGNGLGERMTTAAPKNKSAPAKPSNRSLETPKPALSPRNILPTIREFANWKIGLRYISANVKDYLSLFFTMIGTFFTWRSYRIQKTVQRNHAPGSES